MTKQNTYIVATLVAVGIIAGSFGVISITNSRSQESNTDTANTVEIRQEEKNQTDSKKELNTKLTITEGGEYFTLATLEVFPNLQIPMPTGYEATVETAPEGTYISKIIMKNESTGGQIFIFFNQETFIEQALTCNIGNDAGQLQRIQGAEYSIISSFDRVDFVNNENYILFGEDGFEAKVAEFEANGNDVNPAIDTCFDPVTKITTETTMENQPNVVTITYTPNNEGARSFNTEIIANNFKR